MNKNLISFIIPAYNRSILLEETLSSVIKQRKDQHEILVIDDGSKEAIQNSLGVKFPSAKFIRLNKNYGPAKARNVGLQKARGKFIVFLDSDDILKKEYSESMIQAVEERQNAAILCLSHSLISKDLSLSQIITFQTINLMRNLVLKLICYTNNQKLVKEAFFGVSLSRIIFPRESLKSIKFNEQMKNCEDWDFILRYLDSYNIYILPKGLLFFRFTKDSLTHIWRRKTNWKYYDEVLNILPKKSRYHPLILGFRLYKKIFKNFT